MSTKPARTGLAIAVFCAAVATTGCGGTGSSGSAGMQFSNVARAGSPTGGSANGPPSTYTVSATVTGLTGEGLVIELNGGQDQMVAADGTVAFPTGLMDGTAYVVTVKTQPATRREICGVGNGSGTISQANVSNVAITCSIVAGFLYQTASQTPGGNQLLSYGISPGTGALVPFGTPQVSESLLSAMVTSPGGAFLVVSSYSNGSDVTDGSLSVYAVNSDTGTLTPVSSIVTTGFNPLKMVISPQGFLFVFGGNSGPPGFPAVSVTVNTYVLDASTGTLTPSGTSLTFSGSSVTSLAVRPDGKFLYLLNADLGSNTPAPATLTAYAIDATTGGLTPGPVLSWTTWWNNTTSPGSSAMAIDALGRFLYLASEQGDTIQAAATVLPYAIDADSGALTPIGTGTPVTSDAGVMTGDPSGRYLYVLNELNSNAANDTVLALAIDQTAGAVSALGSPLETPGAPFSLLCDPSGQFVYVGTDSTTATDLEAFAISTAPSTAGQLVPSGQSGSSGATTALAIVE